MSFSIVHLSDPHFGGVADLAQIEAVEILVPELEPNLVVLSGDLSQRARHGEFQRARAFVRALELAAPVHVIPGNHDLQWWRRPFIPFGPRGKYAKYRQYFGAELTPALSLPDAVVVGALTAHGVAWGSLTPRLRDIAVKGHLPRSEVLRAQKLFTAARPEQTRILVVHHNVLRGELSKRMGLARWKTAQQRVAACGADLVLCGHDHQEHVDVLDGIVVACAGTLSTRSRGGRPPVFFRIVVDDEAVTVEHYRWDAGGGVFRRSHQHQFARRRPVVRAVPAT